MANTYVISIPEEFLIGEFEIVGGTCCGAGGGSSEYAFETKAQLDAAAKNIAHRLRALADQYERGLYSECVEDDDDSL